LANDEGDFTNGSGLVLGLRRLGQQHAQQAHQGEGPQQGVQQAVGLMGLVGLGHGVVWAGCMKPYFKNSGLLVFVLAVTRSRRLLGLKSNPYVFLFCCFLHGLMRSFVLKST